MREVQSTFRLLLGLSVLCLMIAVACVVGGDLNPGNTPSPTMRTLDELYKNIQPGLPSDWLPYPTEQQVVGKGAILMSVTGQVQGRFHGSAIEDMIKVVGLGHQLVNPVDAASGLPTGKRQHKPMVISKYIDSSTPQLYRSQVTHETLTHVYLRFFRKDAVGREDQYYTIDLVNARIIDVNLTTGEINIKIQTI